MAPLRFPQLRQSLVCCFDYARWWARPTFRPRSRSYSGAADLQRGNRVCDYRLVHGRSGLGHAAQRCPPSLDGMDRLDQCRVRCPFRRCRPSTVFLGRVRHGPRLEIIGCSMAGVRNVVMALVMGVSELGGTTQTILRNDEFSRTLSNETPCGHTSCHRGSIQEWVGDFSRFRINDVKSSHMGDSSSSLL